jgi:protein-S-isoprenylcysteine O-methyltransferase Ste14
MTETDIESSTPTPSDVGRPPFLVRRRTVFTWLVPLLLVAAVLKFHRQDGGIKSLIAGIVLVFFGEVVRFWAAGFIAKDQIVTTGGPYGYVRNPLYFGSLLLAVGYGLVSGLGWPAILILVVLFLVFHLAAILYEEKFLKNKFGAPYLDYISRVPRLIPSPWPRTRGEGEYSGSKALGNREHISALFAVVFVIILIACRYMGH